MAMIRRLSKPNCILDSTQPVCMYVQKAPEVPAPFLIGKAVRRMRVPWKTNFTTLPRTGMILIHSITPPAGRGVFYASPTVAGLAQMHENTRTTREPKPSGGMKIS